MGRLLPVRFVRFDLVHRPSCFGRPRHLVRGLPCRFEGHSRIRIAFLHALRDWALVAFDDFDKGAGCTEVVGTVVTFEGVALCMSERYALVCYSCNKLLPWYYEG